MIAALVHAALSKLRRLLRAPRRAARRADFSETLPLIFRSEAFAEDLCSGYPARLSRR